MNALDNLKSVVLLKATKMIASNTSNSILSMISEYYVKTKDNGGYKIFGDKKITILKYNGSHSDWFVNENTIDLIVSSIKNAGV